MFADLSIVPEELKPGFALKVQQLAENCKVGSEEIHVAVPYKYAGLCSSVLSTGLTLWSV